MRGVDGGVEGWWESFWKEIGLGDCGQGNYELMIGVDGSFQSCGLLQWLRGQELYVEP